MCIHQEGLKLLPTNFSLRDRNLRVCFKDCRRVQLTRLLHLPVEKMLGKFIRLRTAVLTAIH